MLLTQSNEFKKLFLIELNIVIFITCQNPGNIKYLEAKKYINHNSNL